MSTKFATQIGTRSPVSGWIASTPSGMPRFSIVSSAASVDAAALALGDERLQVRVARAAARCASGCSAATAMYVTP